MSTLFDDLEENLRKTYNTSLKESFDDMGLDEEERDKIVNRVSGSALSDLNVDYSDFTNHVFFGSAYAAANFALARIIRDFPTDGELKEKNAWRDTNTGYENWFFDQFPKQQGYLQLASGSSGYAIIKDYQQKLDLASGSVLGPFTMEAVVQGQLDDDSIEPLISTVSPDAGPIYWIFSVRGATSGRPKLLNFSYNISGSGTEITASLEAYASQSVHVATTYDPSDNHIRLYINGDEAAKKNVQANTGSIRNGDIEIGHIAVSGLDLYLSGKIDDVRIWKTSRPQELIKRNYYRTIHANHSGALAAYYKFNQPSEYGNKVIDWSGNGLHAELTATANGSTTYAANFRSGTLGSWFKDDGDPILALHNTRTDAFVTEQRNSGSAYDDDNQNMIFNLVPSVFVDGDNTEYQQLFLLLSARHFDRLKLYIQHLSNVTKTKTSQFDGPPDNLLDLAAKHYGLDIGGIYAAADPLQNFFGENIYSSGALDSSINSIRTILKRNIVANMSHLLKSKATQEGIKSTLRSIGLNDNIVSISEYTDFSGGVQTTFSPKTVEQRVAHFLTSSKIYASSSTYFGARANDHHIHQLRFLMNTGSAYLSQTLMSYVNTSNSYFMQVRAERSNLTGTTGKLRFIDSTGASFTSSIQPMWNNNWINLTLNYDSNLESGSFYVSSMDRNGLIFSASDSQNFDIQTSVAPMQIVLGTSGTTCFDGHMHEYRSWFADSSWADRKPMYNRWGFDWSLTEIENPLIGYQNLITYLKLDDFTGSITGGGPIHDYANGLSGASYTGFSSSADFNFPGKYIDKFDIAHTYDLNVDNEKIRIRNTTEFTDNDQNYDIPFVSIDFSPVTSLNKEIMKWMGNLERLAQIVADPIYAYRDTNAELDALRSAFFRERVNSRIDYAAFANLIKWFDGNFGYLLAQFIPLDMGYSISNYVIEPHILEYNKVKKFVGAGAAGRTSNLEASVSVRPQLTASSAGSHLGLADPGRYGAFVSASAEISRDVYITYSSSSIGINFENSVGRKVMDTILRDDLEKNSPDGYGNGFYTRSITGSNYLKNSLNVYSMFVSGVSSYDQSSDAGFVSSSHGTPSVVYTGSFDGYQDARWLWIFTKDGTIDESEEQYRFDHGLGYGGMYGQLRGRNNKSIIGKPLFPNDANEQVGSLGDSCIGESSIRGKIPNVQYIRVFNDDKLKTHVLWPNNLNSYDGIQLFMRGVSEMYFLDGNEAGGFGDTIDIEGYNTLNIEILGRTNPIGGASNYVELNFELKFQFYSLETPGTYGFETVMSASRDASGYNTKAVERSYNLRTDQLPKDKILNFTLTMERSLPKQKFMRVFITPTCTDGLSVGSFTVLVKGVLSNNERTVDDLEVRNI